MRSKRVKKPKKNNKLIQHHCDWNGNVILDPHLTSLKLGHPSFIVKCGAASNLEPALRMLHSHWSRHHMTNISIPPLALKSTLTRSDI